MGSYISFINSMLGLREQKLKEEQLQAEAERAEMAAITESLSSLGSSIGGAFKAYGQGQEKKAETAMYNQMSEQAFGAPPRAQAVMPAETSPMTPTSGPPDASGVSPMSTATSYVPDPEMQRQADAAAATMPGFYTGGEAEFNMRMKMEDSATNRLKIAMAQKKIDDDLAFKKSKFLVEQARKDTTARDKKLDQTIKNRKSYTSEMAVFNDALAKAKTPIEYDRAVKSILDTNQAYIDYGVKVDPISPDSIPPFESETDKLAREAQELQVEAARTQLQKAKDAPMGSSDTFRTSMGLTPGAGAIPAIGYEGLAPLEKDKAIAAATKKWETQQTTLREMQPKAGVSAVGPSTVSQSAPTSSAVASSGGMQTISSQEASAQAGKPIAPGTTLKDKYGNKILVR